ncbi:MAG TPA: PD-(D/E)XK nuclease family protein [Planctomycetes bacterium]|nr:PD-(D/E)XK nuclease family protein [Planctomycetota bacterium]
MTSSFLHPIAQTCRDFILEQKWLLAPNRRIGSQWKDQVNLSGTHTVNVHTETIKSAALRIVSDELVSRGLEFASGVRSVLIAGKVLEQLLEAGQLSYLHHVESTDKLAQLVAKSIDDIRMADVSADHIDSSAFEVTEKASDLKLLVQRYEEELTRQQLMDYSVCLRLATQLIISGSAKANLPKSLVVICPLEIASNGLERAFLQALENSSMKFVAGDSVSPTESQPRFVASFQRTVGEVNEVNAVLQGILKGQSRTSFDQVEILHTDYSTYVPLIHETLTSILCEASSSVDDLPVTFGEGLACIYSRPGRALRSWLRWIRSDYLQTLVVQMIREGLLRFENNDGPGFSQLGHRLRELPIGFGSSRYRDRLGEAVRQARADIEMAAAREDKNEFTAGYDFGLAAFGILNDTIPLLIDGSPQRRSSSLQILSAARAFLEQYARSVNKLDHYAKDKLLDDIGGMEKAIANAPEISIDVWDWLEQLPVESRILADGPRPGRVHVDHIARGGHSGRANTCILGLDDSRFPYRGGQDPLLLDFERKNLSADLQTSGDANRKSSNDFRKLLNRLAGHVSFSFATYSLASDREQFPSSALLDTFRLLNKQPDATLEDFENHVGTPRSFCPTDASSFIHADQWWFSKMAAEMDSDQKSKMLDERFQHFGLSRAADQHRASSEFTAYDGFVPAVGNDLDPTRAGSRRVSPSRLETFGVCPRKFFFRYGLGIASPEEHVVDSEQWLDALTLGSLIHEVFEEFLRGLTSTNRIPDLSNDLPDLQALLHRKVAGLRDVIPIPNQDAYQRQLQRLEKTCEIFLRHEETHCRATGAVPWIFEASVGLGEDPSSVVDLAEPVPLRLSDGRVLQVGGRIDRIDRIGDPDSLQFAIWDYKSGSSWGFDASDPMKQGRKLQPFLYVGMLRHRLDATFGTDARVGYFGYFFPSPRTEGLRLQWTTAELASGDAVLRHVCDAIAAGAFPATTERTDCGFCDYLPICGDPFQIASNSLLLLQTSTDKKLDPLRRLREVELRDGEGRP